MQQDGRGRKRFPVTFLLRWRRGLGLALPKRPAPSAISVSLGRVFPHKGNKPKSYLPVMESWQQDKPAQDVPNHAANE